MITSNDPFKLTLLTFDRLVQNPMLGLQLSGALSDLDWDGWRLIELPFTLKLYFSKMKGRYALT